MTTKDIELSIRAYLNSPLRDWTNKNITYYIGSSILDRETANTGDEGIIEVETVRSQPNEYLTFSGKLTESIIHTILIDFEDTQEFSGKEGLLNIAGDLGRFFSEGSELQIIKPVKYNQTLVDRYKFDLELSMREGNQIDGYEVIPLGLNEFNSMDMSEQSPCILYRQINTLRVFIPYPYRYIGDPNVPGDDIDITPNDDLEVEFRLDQNGIPVLFGEDEDGREYFFRPTLINLFTNNQTISVEETSYIFIDQDDPGSEERNDFYIQVKDNDFSKEIRETIIVP